MIDRYICGIRLWGLVLAASLLASGTASAQMAISPIIVETKAYPGGVKTFQVTVANIGKVPLEINVRVSAMAVLPGGMPVETEKAERSCKDWIKVTPGKFTLKPKEGKKLVCQARVPKGVGGGYYAILSCHGIPASGEVDAPVGPGVGAGINLTHRALVPVMLVIPAPQVQAIIDAAPPIIEARKGSGELTLGIPVRNRGNIHCRMAGEVEVRSEAGQLIKKFSLEAGRGFILPMHERLFRGDLRVSLPDGAYLAHIRLKSQGAKPMQNVFPFYVRQGQPKVATLTDELRAKLKKQSAGFAIFPPQALVTLSAGGRRTHAVELVNLTKESLELRASLVEWFRDPVGRDLVSSDKPSHDHSGRDWATLREETMTLRPLSRQRVIVTISPPKTAVGERYLALTFDRVDVQLDASPIGRARRSARLRLWVQGTGEEKAAIAAFEVNRKADGTMEFVARCRNTGDMSIQPEASFAIQREDGNSIGKVAPMTQPAIVQAGGEGIIKAYWPRVLSPGTYRGELTLRYSGNKPPIVRRIEFSVPPLPTTQPAAKEPPEGKE
jgi:hypothetical protein